VIRERYLKVLSIAFAMLWITLAIAPYDRDTWLLENALLLLVQTQFFVHLEMLAFEQSVFEAL